jgi:hypothetical protein
LIAFAASTFSLSKSTSYEGIAMANEKPAHQGIVGQNNTVTQAQGYLNYIGESRVYFLLPNLGWQLYLDINDQALKMQVLTAFAHPQQFKVYVFYQGTTVNSVQVVTA